MDEDEDEVEDRRFQWTYVRCLDDDADPGGLQGLGDRHGDLFGQPLLNWRTNMNQVRQNKQRPDRQRKTKTLNSERKTWTETRLLTSLWYLVVDGCRFQQS